MFACVALISVALSTTSVFEIAAYSVYTAWICNWIDFGIPKKIAVVVKPLLTIAFIVLCHALLINMTGFFCFISVAFNYKRAADIISACFDAVDSLDENTDTE